MRTLVPLLLSAFLVSASGCVTVPGTVADFSINAPQEKTPEGVLCGQPDLPEDGFCMPGPEFERYMREGSIRFLDGKATAAGISGAMKMLIELTHPDVEQPMVFNVKWKPAPTSWAGVNNSPRKEIAAYQVQKLLLPTAEWVVPPTVMRCVPTAPGVALFPERAGGEELPCVWGMLSYWLNHLEGPGQIDWDRYEADLDYRRAISNLNMFMFLISHRDAHDKNWLLTTGPVDRRAVSVDNGISFSGISNPRVHTDWNGLMVPSVPIGMVERLRTVSDGDLGELLVVGRWLKTETSFVNQGDDGLYTEALHGTTWTASTGELEHGLRVGELAGLRRRIVKLLRAVDSGRMGTY
jgi:hypothetical protein